MYQMNHRVVANGSPLEHRFDNIARAARRAGYVPTLFGYTDQGVDPSMVSSSADPRLDTYEGILPGFEVEVELDGRQHEWVEMLRARGFVVENGIHGLATESERPAALSVSAYLVDHLLQWLSAEAGEVFVHASFIRPHPPYAAAGEYSTMYDPRNIAAPISPADDRHGLHEIALSLPGIGAPTDAFAMAQLMAQYFGMITEVDAQVGRILDAVEASGNLESTIFIVTSDHGEQLGDHGLLEKLGFFEQSYRIPLIISDPRRPQGHGTVVESFTEAVDVFPTLLELLELPPSPQCDGASLVPFLNGDTPRNWRYAAHYEWDWRYLQVGPHRIGGAVNTSLRACNLAVLRTSTHALVAFGDGETLCFNVKADPTWRTIERDGAVESQLVREMLAWRSQHLGGTYTEMLLAPDRPGRWPELPVGLTVS
jgi:arylsulfatase A-like enzyme